MGKKVKVIISESDFVELLIKNLLGGSPQDIVSKMFDTTKKTTDGEDKKDLIQKVTDYKFTGGEFPTLNLNNPDEYKAYKNIADKFISNRSSNLLGINGSMLADAAKNAFNQYKKYVPVELALGQLAAEGGFSKNPKARPIRTKNPFNVGNTDSGSNEFHSSVQSGIQRYYDLIAKNYLVGDKTASDLLKNFVNKNNNRYASGPEYEVMVRKIANQAKDMGEPIYASLKKDITSNLA